MQFNIGALGFSTGPSDLGWSIGWHHKLDVTWRWSASLDYFWRSEGFSGPVLPIERRQWKWRYLIPGAYQNVIFRSFDGRRLISPSGSFGCGWMGFSFMFSYQPKWDRSFDANKASRDDRDRAKEAETTLAIKERSSININQLH